MGIIKDEQVINSNSEPVEQMNEFLEEEEQQGEPLNMSVEEFVTFIGNTLSFIRVKYPEDPKIESELRDKFVEKYKSITVPILLIIGFDRALMEAPIRKLPPKLAFWLGIAVLVGFGFFIKVEMPELEGGSEYGNNDTGQERIGEELLSKAISEASKTSNTETNGNIRQ